MKIAEKAKKRLPHPIIAILRPIYNIWYHAFVLDKELLQSIMEYLDLSHNEAICMLKSGWKLNAVYWNILHPKTAEEIQRFYEVTPFYIFDLAYWHMQKGMRAFRKEVLVTVLSQIKTQYQ